MALASLTAWLYWDPNPNAFNIPLIDHPVRWYGVLFAFSFILGYWILLRLFRDKLKDKNLAFLLTDRMTWFIVCGTIIGARLGHVFFYEWPRYKNDPIEIIKVWEGGLASHGGAIGVILALYLYYRIVVIKKAPSLSFLNLLDIVCIPTALVGCFIRLGNFMNQEILGIPSDVPWAIIFGHSYENMGSPLPRHPVQLYEALAYLSIFVILSFLWKFRLEKLKSGFVFGLFLVLLFSSRFFLEFWKTNQSIMLDESWLQTGQYLSIPFILAGLFLLFRKNDHSFKKGPSLKR